MTVQHGGTPEAYVAVSIGRSVIYMHTRATTERFGTIWRAAQVEALQLPRVRTLQGLSAPLPDAAEPSIVIHAAGQPAASIRLSRSTPTHLSITIADVAFLVYDQRAFASVAEPFLRAMEVGRRELAAAERRRGPVRHAEPALAGQQAERAARALPQPRADDHGSPGPLVHPAARAAAAFTPPPPDPSPDPDAGEAGRSRPERPGTVGVAASKPPGRATGRAR